MKILVAHNRYRSAAPSGENRVVDQEREALLALGHDVVQFERQSDEIERWSMPHKMSLPLQVIWNRQSYRRLRAVLKEWRPDVVHVHNTFPLLSPAILYACREAAVPVVATIHNKRLMCARGDYFRAGEVCHDCATGIPVAALRHACYQDSRAATASVILSSRVQLHAWRSMVSAYIFVSASQRDMHDGMGFDESRVFVRHHLIPHRPASPALPGAAVVYAGRLDEAKGIHLLMAAWDAYQHAADPAGLRLVVAGSGPLSGEVTAWAASRPSVDVVGQLNSDRCAQLISGARAVLLPSTCEETFGLVAVEAMAAGVPPVAADHGSFSELIISGVDGVLFRPGDPDALASVIGDVDACPEHYRDLGAAARTSYEKRFDPGDSAEYLERIYQFATSHPR